MALKNKFIILCCLALFGCAQKGHIVFVDRLLNEPDTTCNWNDQISKVTLSIFRKNNIIGDDASNFSIRAIHIGIKKANYVGEINCNASFQSPKYLCFSINDTITVFTDYRNFESIYDLFQRYCIENKLSTDPKNELWNKIMAFVTNELFNSRNKISWR